MLLEQISWTCLNNGTWMIWALTKYMYIMRFPLKLCICPIILYEHPAKPDYLTIHNWWKVCVFLTGCNLSKNLINFITIFLLSFSMLKSRIVNHIFNSNSLHIVPMNYNFSLRTTASKSICCTLHETHYGYSNCKYFISKHLSIRVS